jgi:hypothetical protein
MDGQENEDETTGDDNTDEQSINTSSPFTHPQTSFLTRRLKSFPPPNLTVLVGPSQRVFRYHAFILASQSDYVDTLLSSPAAMNERQQMKISFPEVDAAIWEKMIQLIEPGGLWPTPKLADLVEVLPFYDKYQFRVGLQICDTCVSDVLSRLIENSYGFHTAVDENAITSSAVLSYDLNLPKSKSLAVKYAASRLKYIRNGDEQLLTNLLPLLENDDATLRTLVFTLYGKKCQCMTVDEILKVTKREDFAKQCILMHGQVIEVDEQISQLGLIKSVYIDCNTDAAKGTYELCRASEFDPSYSCIFPSGNRDHKGGAMKNLWVANSTYQRVNSDREKFVLEAMDVFGNCWEISCVAYSEDGERISRRVLYRFQGPRSSIVPPKQSWVAVEQHPTSRLNSRLRLDYHYVTGANCY